MQVTRYFAETRKRSDRQMIADDWIARAVSRPEHVSIQADGRLRDWVRIDEAEGRMLRVVLLPDGTITMEHARERADIPQFSFEQIAA